MRCCTRTVHPPILCLPHPSSGPLLEDPPCRLSLWGSDGISAGSPSLTPPPPHAYEITVPFIKASTAPAHSGASGVGGRGRALQEARGSEPEETD